MKKLALLLVVFWTGCQAVSTGIDAGESEDGLRWDGNGWVEEISGDGSGEEDREILEPACLPWVDLRGEELRQALYDYVNGHQALSYDQARHELFTFVDNNDGWVECVYTGEKIQTNNIPNPDIMNTEHTWCQSWGADVLPAKSDLNHLFPVMAEANTTRSNYPFGEVELANWERGGSKLGLDGWGDVVFEPRDAHKGDAARAIFYFSIRYNMGVDDKMEVTLRKWNWYDPPDNKEKERADKIEKLQRKRNPFVDCPSLVDWIYNF